MTTLTSSLIVRLVDQVTGPARAVASSLLGIRNATGATFGQRLNVALDRNNAALDRARGGLVDAVAGYYALRTAITAPMQAAANFETQLEDIGQKAGIPTERLAALGEQIRAIGIRTNQASSQIASSVDALVGLGASIDQALTAADPIGRAATAYRASTDDLAAAAWAVVNNLRVPANEVGTALDMMAQAGKEGAFEIRDMARHIPALAAQYQGLGQSGTAAVGDLAAALQIVRMGTGDASTAATNLQNVLQKVYAPATIRSFRRLGVNIRDEMQRAAEAGQTPIEAIAEITNRTLGGDLSRLGEVFEDAQVQAGIRSLIQNMEQYRRIRAETLSAQGVVDGDFARRLQTAQGAIDRWNATMENLKITIGAILVPLMNDLLGSILPVVNGIAQWAEANPDLARTIAAVTGGLVAFRVALAGLTFLGLLGKGGALALLAVGFNSVGRAILFASTAARGAVGLQVALAAMSGLKVGALSRIGIGLVGIARAAPGLGLVVKAIAAIGIAIGAMSLGRLVVAGAGIAALAAAGVLLWKYWDRVSSVVGGFARRLGEELGPAIEFARPALDWLGTVGQTIGAGFELASNALGTFTNWLGSFFQQEVGSEAQKAAWGQAGYDFADALINAVKARILEWMAWWASLPGMIVDAIGSIDIASLIRWPTPPAWLTWLMGGGNAGAPAGPANAQSPSRQRPPIQYTPPSGARATGGPVWPGGSFLVGEREPEIFSPATGGRITPLSKMGGNKIGQIGPFHITGGNADETAAKVARAVEDAVNRMLRGAHSDNEVWTT